MEYGPVQDYMICGSLGVYYGCCNKLPWSYSSGACISKYASTSSYDISTRILCVSLELDIVTLKPNEEVQLLGRT